MEYPDCDFLLPDLDLLQTSGCIQQKPVIWKRDGSNACLQLQASIGSSHLTDNVAMHCAWRPEIKSCHAQHQSNCLGVSEVLLFTLLVV